ncbi:hypothetical protein DR864_29280 (plasmid) [Runella rosea]|uniref:DJ-1/PfpI domain-containing protein n=1 Tax=Runella rosea TaxID=2259595 RepID=A0A344TTI7_9BACT|nr:nuclear transport factor 2 family protein [Runella rosea]AXE21958.1 hypothetical protein DR864_29280 [Runella rosea]
MMNRKLKSNTLVLVMLLLVTAIRSHAQPKKILIVSTNRDSVGTNVSGTFLKEIAYPFQYFTDKGFEVDIVTPKGGKAAIYSTGEVPDVLRSIRQSTLFMAKTSATLKPDEVTASKYAAVFYPGGHGQYFDVISDERIARLTATIYENGGTIGTAGHGVASLIDVKLSSGKYLIDGKRITCFPHWAELAWMNISSYGKLLPFDMQEVLARRGANLVVSTKETASDKALTLVADHPNRLVTGSFASSAPWVAEQMVSIISRSESPSETVQILRAVNNYAEGRNSGNIDRMKQAFHAGAVLKAIDEKTKDIVTTPIADYIARNKPGQKHDCSTDVRLLDYTATTAIARVTFTYTTHAYHDNLILLKVKDQWLITEKVYSKTVFQNQ